MATTPRHRLSSATSLASLLLLLLTPIQPSTSFQLGHLLSTCIDACQRGCAEIRTVQSTRCPDSGTLNQQVEFKELGDAKSALTEADVAAQAAICGALRAEWGESLIIVGEEDDNGILLKEKMAQMEPFAALDRTLLDDDFPDGMADIDPVDITIYVDPLDATREFVEGRLENCQSLIGIAIGNEAVAGVIGIPFPKGDLSTDPTIVYGLSDVGTGVIGEPLSRGPYPLEKHIDGVKFPRPHFGSGDSTAPVMVGAQKALIKGFGGSNILYSGAGNKILAASLGEVNASFQPKFGGPWDVCAPEAVLKAMGGRITDLFGEEIALYGKDAVEGANNRGYVATTSAWARSHDALIKNLNNAAEVQEYRKSIEE